MKIKERMKDKTGQNLSTYLTLSHEDDMNYETLKEQPEKEE